MTPPDRLFAPPLQSLIAQHAAIEREIAAERRRLRALAIGQIRRLCAAHGIGETEVFGQQIRRAA